MATEGLAGVREELAGVGEDDGGDVGFRVTAHHVVELDEGNSMVVSLRTGSARFHQKSSSESSPEFSRCKSLARVCGS
jgi:hypothetical protein